MLCVIINVANTQNKILNDMEKMKAIGYTQYEAFPVIWIGNQPV